MELPSKKVVSKCKVFYTCEAKPSDRVHRA